MSATLRLSESPPSSPKRSSRTNTIKAVRVHVLSDGQHRGEDPSDDTDDDVAKDEDGQDAEEPSDV